MIPDFRSFMLPILQFFSDEHEHTINECILMVKDCFGLDENSMKKMVPSGKQTIVSNRVYWSLTYLKKSLLLKIKKRGIYIITNRGKNLLKTNPKKIDNKLLMQYKEYRVFKKIDKEDSNINDEILSEEITPEENIYIIHKKIEEQLSNELLEMIMDKDGYYFERLVLDVLIKMGYGADSEESKIVTKKTNDEGIDGIINQDKLGLDKIYIQAKRWSNVVGRPELQKFVGALSAKKSNKGIFITTSDFTRDAKEYVNDLNQTIILINGKSLTKYMIDYNVGVQNNYTYEIKKIDNDYFEMV